MNDEDIGDLPQRQRFLSGNELLALPESDTGGRESGMSIVP